MSNHEMKSSVFHFPPFLKAKKKRQSYEIKHLSAWVGETEETDSGCIFKEYAFLQQMAVSPNS